MSDSNELAEVAQLLPDAPIRTNLGIAAIALQLAMKYHDTTMVKDGALYQQYKIEGRAFKELDLVDVFETAKKIEEHLFYGEQRIGALITAALSSAIGHVIAVTNESEILLQALRDGNVSVVTDCLDADDLKFFEDASGISREYWHDHGLDDGVKKSAGFVLLGRMLENLGDERRVNHELAEDFESLCLTLATIVLQAGARSPTGERE